MTGTGIVSVRGTAFRGKAYSLTTFQFRIANYQALSVKYSYVNYSKLDNFIYQLPESYHNQFKAISQEGQLVAKTTLQSSLDTAEHSQVHLHGSGGAICILTSSVRLPEGGSVHC